MKEKITYLIAGLLVYFVVGIAVSYFSYASVDWKFVLFWTVLMTIFDFLIIRNMKKWWSKSKIKQQ